MVDLKKKMSARIFENGFTMSGDPSNPALGKNQPIGKAQKEKLVFGAVRGGGKKGASKSP